MLKNIQIEVPEGKEAVFDKQNNKIIFVDKPDYTKIKTIEDAYNYLVGNELCLSLIYLYDSITEQTENIEPLIEFEVVKAALIEASGKSFDPDDQVCLSTHNMCSCNKVNVNIPNNNVTIQDSKGNFFIILLSYKTSRILERNNFLLVPRKMAEHLLKYFSELIAKVIFINTPYTVINNKVTQ